VTPAAVAVAWTLSFPGVTGAIVGARQPQQVEGWLPAAPLELKEDDLATSPPLSTPPRRDRTRIASPCRSSSGEKVKCRLAADANRTAV
jgi:diketogulonate reductase-like aldo/keto reductase